MADDVLIRLRMQGQAAFSAEARIAIHRIDEIGDAADRAGGKARKGAANFNVLAATVKLLRPAALIVGAGLLAQALSAAAAGGVALASALAPLVGMLVAYPALGLAAAQAMGVWRLATSGVMGAVGGLNTTLDATSRRFQALSPQAQAFALKLEQAKYPIRELQRVAQAGLFPGLGRGLDAAMQNFGRLTPIVRDTARVLGGLAAQAGKMVGSKGFGRDLTQLGNANVVWISRAGRAALHLVNALRNVTMAGMPLVNWMTKGGVSFARFIDQQARAGRESGRLAGFFERTRRVMSQVGSIAMSLGRTLWNVGRAGSALGGDLLRSLSRGAAAMARWTGSAAGQNSIAAFFERARAPIYAVGRLLRDIARDFGMLSSQTGLAPMIDQVRTQLLPILVHVMNATTRAFGPHLIAAITSLAKAFEPLAGSSGPLVLFVDALGGLARAAVWIEQTVPGASAGLSALFGAVAVGRAIGIATFTSKLFGLRAGLETVRGAVTRVRAVMVAFSMTTMGTRIGLAALAVQEAALAVGSRVLAGAQLLLNAAMAANPIVLAVAAVAALAAGLYLAYKKVKWFHDAVDAVWSFIKNHWVLIGTLLVGPIVPAVKFIVEHFGEIKRGFSSVFHALAGIATGAFSGVKKVISGVFGWVTGRISDMIDAYNAIPLVPDISNPFKHARSAGPVIPGSDRPGSASSRLRANPLTPVVPLKLPKHPLASGASMLIGGGARPAFAGAGANTGAVAQAPRRHRDIAVVPLMVDGRELGRATLRGQEDDEAFG